MSRAHYDAMDQDIWGSDSSMLGMDVESHSKALQPIADKVERAATALEDSAAVLSGGHRKTAEEMAAVMGQLASMMGEAAVAISKAVGESTPAAMKNVIEFETRQTRTVLIALMDSIKGLDKRMGAIEAAMTAPKHLVMDGNGRPVGVRTVLQ